MQKSIAASAVGIALVIVAAYASVAFADSNYWHINWNDGDDTPQVMHLDVNANEDYEFLVKNPTTKQAELWRTDTSIVWNTMQKRWEIGNISQDNVDLLVPTLAGKASTSSVNSLSSSVSSLSSSVSTLNSTVSSYASQISTLMATTSQADFNQASTTALSYIKNKPTIGKAYEGTTLREGVFTIYKQVTVSSGNVVAHLTSDGTSGGTSLCPNGVIGDSINLQPEEGSAPHAFAQPVWSNSNKTVTIAVTKLGMVLGVLTLNQSANGSVVRLSVACY